MVALALGACSNATEDVANNTNNVEKTAILQLNLGFVNSSSRADGSLTEPNVMGTDAEQKVNDIHVRIHYTKNVDGTSASLPSDITADFTNEGTDFTKKDVSNNKTPYQLKQLEVYPGTATIYVTVNNRNTSFSSTLSTTDYTSLDALQSSGKAASSTPSFIMSGFVSDQTINATADNKADIYVDRLAAKLDEISNQSYNIESNVVVYSYSNGELANVTASKTDPISVSLDSYSFFNLNKESNLYTSAGVFEPQTPNADSYLNYWTNTNNGKTELPTTAGLYKTIALNTANHGTNTSTGVTYCYENGTKTPTYVVYKAIINDGHNFYVTKKNGVVTMYKSFEALNAATNYSMNAWNLTDGSTYDKFLEAGVIKYAGGVCYYPLAIKTTTTNTTNIVRNNWYILQVTGISKIGSPFVDTNDDPENPTSITMKVWVNPWTVNLNSFNLGGNN